MSDVRFPIEQPPEVRAALNRLYLLFRAPRAGLRVNSWIDLCSAEEHARLVVAGAHKPVRDLTQHEFDHLAWHAMCWDGVDPDTLSYFLPRVFDEHFTVVPNAVPIELFVSNLRRAGWPGRWTEEQSAAVTELMNAIWSASLATEGGFSGERFAKDDLWLTAALRLDVGPHLDLWRATQTVAAAVQLGTFLTDMMSSASPSQGKFWGQVWDGDPMEPEVERRVAAWLFSPETAKQLDEAFFATTDRRTQWTLSKARDLLPP